MNELYEKMKEYTRMTDELPLPEFSSYYQQIISCLVADYDKMSKDELLQARALCSIVGANAQSRAARKDANRKKYAKISDKTNFWHEALKARLLKEGATQEEMEQTELSLWPEEE